MLSIAQNDRIAADKVDAADMRVEVDADARPFQTRGHLFDMRRFTGAMVSLNHNAAVMGKASKDRERGVGVKDIAVVGVGNAFIGNGKRRTFHVDIDAEHFAHADGFVRGGKDGRVAAVGLDIWNVSHVVLVK